jgi:hypothetical protein
MTRALFGRSGGLGYHFAASILSKRLWLPFRERVTREISERVERLAGSQDLSGWHLYWVGPSGGYCIRSSLLARFGAVTAIDPDPLAGWLLRRKAFSEFRFERQDFFLELERDGWSLESWLKRHRDERQPIRRPLFLFSNVLGQLEFVYSPERLATVEQGLESALRQTSSAWLSFHDRASVEWKAPRSDRRIFHEASEERWSIEDLAQRFYAALPSQGKKEQVREVGEHSIGAWIGLARPPYVYLSWRLTPAEVQLIELCGSFS